MSDVSLADYLDGVLYSAHKLCEYLNRDDNVNLRVTCDGMPLQLEGMVDRLHCYIRERDELYFELSMSKNPYDEDMIVFSRRNGHDDEILRVIREWIMEYRENGADE